MSRDHQTSIVLGSALILYWTVSSLPLSPPTYNIRDAHLIAASGTPLSMV